MVQTRMGTEVIRGVGSQPAYGSSVPRQLSLDQLLAVQLHPAGGILTLLLPPQLWVPPLLALAQH